MLIGVCGEEFPPVREALAQVIPGAEVVIIPHDRTRALPRVDVLVPLSGRVDAQLLDATRPRLVQQFGVGLQGVDIAAARQRGIPVACIPAADTGNAIAVAEAAIMHLLMLLRRVPQLSASVRHKVIGQPIGQTLAGKTVTVLGTGAIGQALITRLAAFGVTAVGVGRRPYAQQPQALRSILPPERFHPTSHLTKALVRSDALVVAVPLTEETRGLVAESELAAMPPGGYLVNVGRGPVVDYEALLGAFRNGHLAGAGLDVTWEEPMDPGDVLLTHNVIVTPHIGGVTVESYAKMAATFAANVARLTAGDDLANRIVLGKHCLS
jgi:phosphoglycerate dehydrogenase-like enzyme